MYFFSFFHFNYAKHEIEYFFYIKNVQKTVITTFLQFNIYCLFFTYQIYYKKKQCWTHFFSLNLLNLGYICLINKNK